MKLAGIVVIAAAWAAFSCPAQAQIPGQFPAGTLYGNSTAAQAPPQAVTPGALFDRAFCAVNGQILQRVGGVWACVPAINSTQLTATCDGLTDVAATLQSQLNTVAITGGTALMPAGQCVVSSADLTIPENVYLVGSYSAGSQRPSLNYLGLPTSIYLSSARTIRLSSQSGISGVAIIRQGITTPTDIRTAINGIAAFAGTAITIAGSGIGVNTVWRPIINNNLIIGFALGISANWGSFMQISGNQIDATACIDINNSHGVSSTRENQCSPFFNSNAPWSGAPTYTPSNVTNSAGLIQITLGTAASPALVTGDTVVISGVGGVVGANNRWIITVGSSTTFTLNGSSFSGPSLTGTTTNGSPLITGLANVANLAVGQAVSGTGIPAGATLASFNPYALTATLDFAHPATASGSVTVTFANAAYTSGGTVRLPSGARSGTGFKIQNSEGFTSQSDHQFGHDVGFNLGAGASLSALIGSTSDTILGSADPTPIGYLFDGNSFANSISSGSVTAQGTSIVVNCTQNPCISVSGMQAIGPGNPYAVAIYDGGVTFSSSYLRNDVIYVAAGTDALTLGANTTGVNFVSFVYETPEIATMPQISGVPMCQIYTSSSGATTYSWVPRPWMQKVVVRTLGQGGGGGGGAVCAGACSGGAGGGAGSFAQADYNGSAFATPVSVIITQNANGGAGSASGTVGGDAQFGIFQRSFGGGGGSVGQAAASSAGGGSAGLRGAGGSTSTSTAGAAGSAGGQAGGVGAAVAVTPTVWGAGPGGSGVASGGASVTAIAGGTLSPASGGGGAGLAAAPVSQNGATGQNPGVGTTGWNGSGGAGNGTNGSAPCPSCPGGSGGSGASAATGNAFSAGTSAGGAGGSGGGSAVTGNTAGSGAAGGPGFVEVCAQ